MVKATGLQCPERGTIGKPASRRDYPSPGCAREGPARGARIGHALRLILAREHPLGGTVEIDEFFSAVEEAGRRTEAPGRSGGAAGPLRATWATINRALRA
jgi:hypothetical protein